jgi:hypothetical protein
MAAINENTYNGEQLYKITLATGEDFKVYAFDEQEAVNLLADHLVEEEQIWSYSIYQEIATLCDIGQSIAEYAEENNLYFTGKHGVYIPVKEIKPIDTREEFK